MAAADSIWTLTDADGALTVETGVAGRAARMGHRLTLLMVSWRIEVSWSGGVPVAAELVVDVGDLQVQRGTGGVTPLTGAEKGVARANALKTLAVKRFPTIEFQADVIEPTAGGYRLSGQLSIHGVPKPCTVDVAVTTADGLWRLTGQTQVRQRDFGITPFSMMMGAMKVDDVVTVALDAHAAAPTGLR